MSDMTYWMEDAERITDSPGWSRLIGECDNGDLWVWQDGHPYMAFIVPGAWVRFSRRNPRHLMAYLRSKRQGRIVWLEGGTA